MVFGDGGVDFAVFDIRAVTAFEHGHGFAVVWMWTQFLDRCGSRTFAGMFEHVHGDFQVDRQRVVGLILISVQVRFAIKVAVGFVVQHVGAEAADSHVDNFACFRMVSQTFGQFQQLDGRVQGQ